MHIKKLSFILFICLLISLLSFTKSSRQDIIAGYYDKQLDNLSLSVKKFQKSVRQNASRDSLVKVFFECRNNYKKIEFFIDVFDVGKARQLNGPDLLKIERDAPLDSMKPHGLQTIEAVLYAGDIDKMKLALETDFFLKTVEGLRNDPDHIYYFSDDKVWEALRLGSFRIISLGFTGFDVPFSLHTLPETRVVLSSMQKVASFYKDRIPDTLFRRGNILFTKADNYLVMNNSFNTFNRLEFIRDYLNKISEWMTQCSKSLGYINRNQLTPLNPDAPHLFARNIMNVAFFSPNELYKLTPGRIALGRRLFYDARISGNNSRSCASCHQAEKAFTDGLAVPTDISGNKNLPRNTPTLLNAVFQMNQFYDSRSRTLEIQLSEVVHNADEMNGSLFAQVGQLKADKEYSALFKEAYPENADCINEYNIANAISSYVRSLNGLNSRFDRYMRQETDSFTASEQRGFNLFMGKAKCGTCHYAPVFNGLIPPLYQETESEILAVPATDVTKPELDTDEGKFGFTRVPVHKFAFKTPTVRNIALTAPYMHNGVFRTLEDVLKFYNDGGGAGRGILLETQTLPTDKLNLTKKEIKDIVAFLHTLTDTSATNPSSYK